jgi:hypothetical protein
MSVIRTAIVSALVIVSLLAAGAASAASGKHSPASHVHLLAGPITCCFTTSTNSGT